MLVDGRIRTLAKNLINFSCELKKGENILIEATGVDYQLVNALIEETRKAGAYPFVKIYDNRIQRRLMLGMDKELAERMCEFDAYQMDKMQALIYTNSEHFTTALVEQTEMVDLGIDLPFFEEDHAAMHHVTVEGLDDMLVLGYVVEKGHTLSQPAQESAAPQESAPQEKEDARASIRNGINFARKVLVTGECDILILDEILGILDEGIITSEELIMLIDQARQGDAQLILTGTKCPVELAEKADEITVIQTEDRV